MLTLKLLKAPPINQSKNNYGLYNRKNRSFFTISYAIRNICICFVRVLSLTALRNTRWSLWTQQFRSNNRALFSVLKRPLHPAAKRFITRDRPEEERSVLEDFGVGPIDRRRSRSGGSATVARSSRLTRYSSSVLCGREKGWRGGGEREERKRKRERETR